MAMTRKMGLELTVTRKNKQKLIDGQIGKRTALTVGAKKQRKHQMKNKQNYNHRDWAAGLPDHFLELVKLFNIWKTRNEMALKWKIGLETTVTRKNKQKMTDVQIGKRKAMTVGTKKQRKRQMKNKQNDNHRDWAAGLPDHLLELVIERLPLVDCLSFSGVCKPLRSTTSEFFKGSSRVIPLLVKPWQSESIAKTCINVFDKTNKNSTFDIPIPEEYIGSHVWGSYRDWLFLGRLFEDQRQKYVHITLLNPFSGEKVVLPNTRDDYHMVVLSSVPSDPRCIYMLVHRMLGVAFWTSGAGREWRICELMGSNRVVDALYHEGHFYLLKATYEMVIIDEISVINMLNITSEGNNKSSIATQYLPLRAPCSDNARKYIVESNGDLILVCRTFSNWHCYPPVEKTLSFEMYRLDISEMAWVKLESLGNNTNQVVFLGKSCSRSFNTKEIGGGGDDALANKIYFCNNAFTNRVNEWDNSFKYFKDRNDADVWGVFSLNKESRDWPLAFNANARHCAGIWVMAPISWCFRQMQLKRR